MSSLPIRRRQRIRYTEKSSPHTLSMSDREAKHLDARSRASSPSDGGVSIQEHDTDHLDGTSHDSSHKNGDALIPYHDTGCPDATSRKTTSSDDVVPIPPYGHDDAADTRPVFHSPHPSPSHPTLPSPFQRDVSPPKAPPAEHTTSARAHPPPPPLPSEQISDLVSEASSHSHMDWCPATPLISSPGLSESSSSDDSDSSANAPTPISLLPLPTSSPGYVTHAHQQAMANRITHDKLDPGGAFDPAVYTPVFLHDTLMLPGSLATILGKDSLALLDRLTPARLPSHTLLPHHAPPHHPMLLPFAHPSTPAVTGLLLLGSGRESREAIKAHYRPVAKRVRLEVVVEVRVPVPRGERAVGAESERWRLEGRWVEAQVFRWRGWNGGRGEGWELREAIGGAYGVGIGEMEVVEAREWGDRYACDGDDDDDDEGGDGEDGGGGQRDVDDLELDGRSEWARPVVFGGGGEADAFGVEW